MTYNAALLFPGLLYPCYAPEAREDERVKVDVFMQKDCKIAIKAEDSTSLRATLTTLTKLLNVYEKIRIL